MRYEYLATASDLAVFEAGLASLAKAARSLGLDGWERVDLVLQDTRDIYLYSRDASYRLPKLKKAGAYTVYRLPHERRPLEHELWGCRGGSAALLPDRAKAVVAETFFRCAPWGTWRIAQERKRNLYRFKDAYHATLIHELAHQYSLAERELPPQERAIRQRLEAQGLAGFDLDRAAAEGYAEWAELKASRTLFPAHFARKLAAGKAVSAQAREPHDAGLREAITLLDEPAR